MSTDQTQPPPSRIVAKAARPRAKSGGQGAQADAGTTTPAVPGAPGAPQSAGAPPAPGQAGPAANPFAPPGAPQAPPFQPPVDSSQAPPTAGGQAPSAPDQAPPGVPGGQPDQPAAQGSGAEQGHTPGQAPEATEVLAASAAAVATVPNAEAPAPEVGPDGTAVSPTDEAALERARAERAARIEQAEAERQQRLAAQAERARRLGTVTPNAGAEAGPIHTVVTRNTDKFAGSLGLFLLRVVTALVVGVHGFNQLITIDETSALIKTLALPAVLQNSSVVLAWIYAGGGVLAAVLLLFGFLTRFAGLLVAVGSIASLAFVQWGNFQIFVGNGFLGEKELLLVGIGLLFFLLGAGGWALDAGFRRGRSQRRPK